jgi:hypothetical protein
MPMTKRQKGYKAGFRAGLEAGYKRGSLAGYGRGVWEGGRGRAVKRRRTKPANIRGAAIVHASLRLVRNNDRLGGEFVVGRPFVPGLAARDHDRNLGEPELLRRQHPAMPGDNPVGRGRALWPCGITMCFSAQSASSMASGRAGIARMPAGDLGGFFSVSCINRRSVPSHPVSAARPASCGTFPLKLCA